eukprot:TRINITY_DN15959_c0_g1_i1.p1 TRINITY_DN15959_c0_g1~~TRINITY_DN15959_c0_g1_i1.p1  ORF type:complete len:251 (+),score=51.03 TRINITY_DN15959_c0_g1_i1:84-836(+)
MENIDGDLWKSVKEGDEEAALKLLRSSNKQIDINSKDEENGKTLLHEACNRGFEHLVRKLLDMGAEVDSIDGSQYTPLHYAVAAGKPNIVKLLLAKGANIEYQGRDNQTPLHRAAKAGKNEVVLVLLDHKADTKARISAPFSRYNDLTPADFARAFNFNDIAETIEKFEKRTLNTQATNDSKIEESEPLISLRKPRRGMSRPLDNSDNKSSNEKAEKLTPEKQDEKNHLEKSLLESSSLEKLKGLKKAPN